MRPTIMLANPAAPCTDASNRSLETVFTTSVKKSENADMAIIVPRPNTRRKLSAATGEFARAIGMRRTIVPVPARPCAAPIANME